MAKLSRKGEHIIIWQAQWLISTTNMPGGKWSVKPHMSTDSTCATRLFLCTKLKSKSVWIRNPTSEIRHVDCPASLCPSASPSDAHVAQPTWQTFEASSGRKEDILFHLHSFPPCCRRCVSGNACFGEGREVAS